MNKHNKNILVVYTGGTIGMVPSDQGHIASADFCDYLQERLSTCAEPLAGIQIHTIATEKLIDSSNSTPHDWLEIATLLANHWHTYDGFVVLHGTDTMAYSTSALSFIFGDIDKPVIFTGSQIPMLNPNSDAIGNVVGSLQLASQGLVTEVGLYFNHVLWRGNRASKRKRQALDAFYSPNAAPLIAHNEQHDSVVEALLTPKQPVFAIDKAAWQAQFAFNNDHVAVINCYPGMHHHMVTACMELHHLKAIVLQTFGVGNPPDSNRILMSTLEKAANRDIVIANLSQCAFGEIAQDTYASGSVLGNIGAISTSDLTLEATLSKLHVLFAKGYTPTMVRQQLTVPAQGECKPT